MLGVSDRMVRYYLKPMPAAQPRKKHSLLDPFRDYITAKLEETPGCNLVVLRKDLASQGYAGGMTILRVFARQIRDEVIKRAVIRLETLPGGHVCVGFRQNFHGKPSVVPAASDMGENIAEIGMPLPR